MKKLIASALTAAMALSLAACSSAPAASAAPASSAASAGSAAAPAGAVYKVGIVNYVDDASLNQIQQAVEDELAAKGAELGVTFEVYADNGQADSTVLNQIITDQLADGVQLLIPIATPTALLCQSATEDSGLPVVYAAVSDPDGAGLSGVANITGTSDAPDTEAVMNLMLAQNPDLKTVGLLYDLSQDASKNAIAQAKAFCDANGLSYVEASGTTTGEVSLAADSLIASGAEAVFTPQDNTIMTAELAIYEKFINAGVPHYTCADSFALNGAFLGYGCSYEKLGVQTADIAVDVLVNGADISAMEPVLCNDGIATVNSETCAAIGLDFAAVKAEFEKTCTVAEITTAEEFAQ